MEGVRIVVTTDVASHIFVRLSLKPPWIHKKPSLRRGLWLNDDVRFCFTVFEDNEQAEDGDTLTHTFWKPDWPACTTKWLYLWGKISGEVCQSTSPIFEHHNDGLDPIPVPEIMPNLNAIDPQFYPFPGGPVWSLLDLSRDIPEGATGSIWHLRNNDLGGTKRVGLRKPGASYENIQPMGLDGHMWAIVGLNANREIEYHVQTAGRLEGYLMGYTGPSFVFPDDAIDIKPAVNNVYSTFNIHTTWPDAILVLTDMGSAQAWNNYHSIRPVGSTKEVFQGANRMYPFSGLSGGGALQTKLSDRDGASTKWLAYAYIKSDTTVSLNGIDFVGFTANAWKTLDCGQIDPAVKFAFIEYQHPFGAVHLSARKQFSYFDYKGRNSNHGWIISHVHHNEEIQVWSGNTAASDRLLQVAESH